MFRIVCLLIGYGFGCIQSAYIFGRAFGKIDIRDFGSGNAGFTNTTRVLGKKIGAAVFFSDLLKVVLAFVLCTVIFKGKSAVSAEGVSYLPGIYAGMGAVLGHNFPFYLGFRGGKGIACTLGLMLCVDWKVALATFAVGLIVFLLKKYISLASLVMTALYPILMIVFAKTIGFNAEEVVLMVLLAVMAYVRHIPNIKRLINGEENKFGVKTEEVKENGK